MASGVLYSLFSFIFLWDAVDARYCYSYSYNGYESYYCNVYYFPVGSIVGAVIGSLVGLALLIGLIVFFCCIRPRRLAAAGRVIHTPGSNVAVVSTNTVSGGYVNTAAYPPGTQASYPQYTYPPQQAAPPGVYQPPPQYK